MNLRKPKTEKIWGKPKTKPEPFATEKKSKLRGERQNPNQKLRHNFSAPIKGFTPKFLVFSDFLLAKAFDSGFQPFAFPQDLFSSDFLRVSVAKIGFDS